MTVAANKPVGFYADAETHRQVVQWCEEHGITVDGFCRLALSYFFIAVIKDADKDTMAAIELLARKDI